MKKLAMALTALGAFVVLLSCQPSYTYQTVEGDPLQARIYTLDNGLKVYMTVNKDAPRIQTYLAMHVGSKNDPSETTGLAHYFEHLMFKGTQAFGTQNYEAEKPLLDAIEQQFEVYRVTTDPVQRKAIYHVIDSLSLEASKLSIPNEYDKLMAAIGASGTNAWTSYDETVYTENIPSNQIENWAKIQADRFENNVIRGFHTELETVYEEMNMYSSYDSEKILDKTMELLFPKHPYGQHSVIGKQEHLKNPSITNIKKYHQDFYVPNNMAICLSGDFDPDNMIATIDRYFGAWSANPNVPVAEEIVDDPITAPIVSEVWGLEAESVAMAWRGPHILSGEDGLFNVLGMVLNNRVAGIMDIDLVQQQKVLDASAGAQMLADRSMLSMAGSPKEGQTVEEVKDLLLASLAKVRAGDFDASLITAVVNDYKLRQMRQLENNGGRAQQFVTAFINDMPWEYSVNQLARMEAVTKDDLVAFANKYFKDDNMVVIYKRQGPDPYYKKIEKPDISPIFTNRDTSSVFMKEILASQVTPIEPVFVDVEKDFRKADITAGAPLVYVPNTTNDIFQLNLVYAMGSKTDKALPMAFDYLNYVGTSTMSAVEIQRAFYKLACSYSFNVSPTETTFSLSGLSENMGEALDLLESLLADAQPDQAVLDNNVADMLKSRQDAKKSQSANYSRLQEYVMVGPENRYTQILSAAELKALKPQMLLSKVKSLAQYAYQAYYYGPATLEDVVAMVGKKHQAGQTLKPAPACEPYHRVNTLENKVFLGQYDVNQLNYMSYSKRDNEMYGDVPLATSTLYNNYFGSSMNAIVFQEMREARGLAYSARAGYNMASWDEPSYFFTSSIATQNDKMAQAMEAFHEIINDMPQSQKSFDLAKESLIASLRTQRTTGRALINWYRTYEKRLQAGFPNDPNKELYESIPALEMKDLVDFQQKWIKDRPSYYIILSDIKALNLNVLKEYGPITTVPQADYFGY